MSAFLGYESFLINLGSTISQMRDALRTAITAYGWQSPRSSNNALIAQTLGTITNPANVFDNLESTSSAGTVPIWVGFKTVGAVAINRFSITVPMSSAAPKTFTLEWSDDGSTWTVQDTWTNIPAWTNAEIRYFNTTITPATHLWWRLNVSVVQSTSTLTVTDAKFWDSDGSEVSRFEYFDLEPPVGEVIGDAYSKEFVRVKCTATAVGLMPMIYLKRGICQVYGLYEKQAGAFAASVTIGGYTVTQSVTNGAWTAKQNLRQLFYDLQASANANFTAWTYEYQQAPPQNAEDVNDWILMTQNVPADFVAVSVNTYVNGVQLIGSVPVNIPFNQQWLPSTDITVDLVSGWIYYLQVNSRTFSLASKTNVGYYGPVFGWWKNHADALITGVVSKTSSLAECIVGWHDVPTPGVMGCVFSYFRAAHAYCIPGRSFVYINTSQSNLNFPTSGMLRGKVMDCFQNGYSSTSSAFKASASGVFGGVNSYNVGNDFQVHQVVFSDTSGADPTVYTSYCSMWYPTGLLDSVYKFIGTSTDESCQLIQDSQTSTGLSTAFDEAAVMAGAGVVNVTSTAAFASAGYFVIGDECFQYTGKTAGTFTGVTRAKFGTLAYRHYSADLVYQGLWFVKINGGALFAGYVRPT